MANDRNDSAAKTGSEQQPAQSNEQVLNPFKDAAGDQAPPSAEEQAALEQQHKEAMTERD